jgi:hypothetical protein
VFFWEDGHRFAVTCYCYCDTGTWALPFAIVVCLGIVVAFAISRPMSFSTRKFFVSTSVSNLAVVAYPPVLWSVWLVGGGKLLPNPFLY